MQYLDLLFVLVIGFAIGRTVGYYMQLRSEREWTACLERLGGWSAPPVARGVVPAASLWRGQRDGMQCHDRQGAEMSGSGEASLCGK